MASMYSMLQICNEEETVTHLFIYCQYSFKIWIPLKSNLPLVSCQTTLTITGAIGMGAT